MKTVFCKPNEILNHKIIENYPNKQIKKCMDNEGNEYKLHIIETEDCITIEPLTIKNALYFCGKKVGSGEITMLTLNWFPKELVVGVEGKYYSENTKLSKLTGFVQSSGNTGSSSECFLTSKVGIAIEKLWGVGFEVDIKRSAQNDVITRWIDKLNTIGYCDASISVGNTGIYIHPSFINDKLPSGKTIKNNIVEFQNKLMVKILEDYKITFQRFKEKYS